jgi:hypothetical protein
MSREEFRRAYRAVEEQEMGENGTVEDAIADTVKRNYPVRPSVAGLYPLTRDAPLTGEQAVERLPTSIRIGPFDYKVDRLTDLEVSRLDRWGDCWPGQFVIRIAPSIPSAVKVADAMLHEIMHAMFNAFHVENGDSQERIVTALGTGWTQVYRDNPWLLDWLKECLR